MRIAIVTDAWHPQVNGVVKTLSMTTQTLEKMGHSVLIVQPSDFVTVPCPTYPEIRLSIFPSRRLNRTLSEFEPDAIHIATEGPLGAAARRWCLLRGFSFTTSYHTQFPEYLRARAPVPLAFSYECLRRFHGAAARIMAATPTLQLLLEKRGFRNVVRWARGVDLELFRPGRKDFFNFARPIAIYVGRVAMEKNIEDFLRINMPGTKIVVGDGPALEELQAKYPQVKFVGYKFGEDLARHVAAADVFVFPSRTDTFGLVLLEAMACGVPVAAYPVVGPIDVVKHSVSGILDDDLSIAAQTALKLEPQQCRLHATQYSWESATEQFLGNLVSLNGSARMLLPPTPAFSDVAN